MKLYVDDIGIRITLEDGGEIEVGEHHSGVIDGLVGELADGETFVCADGCSVTRRGEEEIWATPAAVVAARVGQ